jgi:hypothetical protein
MGVGYRALALQLLHGREQIHQRMKMIRQLSQTSQGLLRLRARKMRKAY